MDNLQIGMNGRFFPNNWRPALDEIAFAAANSFAAIQFPGKEEGLSASHLGAELGILSAALAQAGIAAVMEIMVRVDTKGRTAAGNTLVEILKANLPAISALGCRCVHVHPIALPDVQPGEMPTLEQRLALHLAAGADLGVEHGFRFGFEHNEPGYPLFASPTACGATLGQIPHLWFVWDLNHTVPDDVSGFEALIPRMSMLHVSDTLLPEVNYHLPLGLGNIDFVGYCETLRADGFIGPAILEIGGLPKSGGFNRDTDDALIASLQLLKQANQRTA